MPGVFTPSLESQRIGSVSLGIAGRYAAIRRYLATWAQEHAVKEMVAAGKVADYVKACVQKLADENGMAPAAPAK
jgi:hypothetical protein